MSRTTRRRPERRSRSDASARHRPQPEGVEILNLRGLSGDISVEGLLARDIVRVDRATEWGNPYPIGKRFGSRAEVIERYRAHLWRRIHEGELPLEKLAAIAGKPLACWCHPRPCHAEVLARAAQWAAERIEKNSETP